MTLPYERVNAVKNTRRFLVALMTPSLTPRVPLTVRLQARSLLKHYPWDMEADVLGKECLENSAGGVGNRKGRGRSRGRSNKERT